MIAKMWTHLMTRRNSRGLPTLPAGVRGGGGDAAGGEIADGRGGGKVVELIEGLLSLSIESSRPFGSRHGRLLVGECGDEPGL